MSNNEELFEDFKTQKYKIIDNIYEDKEFADYYEKLSELDKNSDIFIYEKYLNPIDVTLEIGSGNGRVFTPLFNNNYNIYGIEPSKEMIKYIPNNAQNRIYNLQLQHIKEIDLKNINNVIIPGTSISLFSYDEIDDLFKYLRGYQSKIKTILFDFLPTSYFINSDRKIMTMTINGIKYYTVNFFSEDRKRVFFNIIKYEKQFNNKVRKIGISKKNLYSEENIKAIFQKYNVHYNLISKNKDYIFVRGEFE